MKTKVIKRENFHFALLLIIAAAVIYLFFRIIQPFLVPIIWAIVLVILFYPLYVRMVPRMKTRGLAALFATLIILVVLIGPVLLLTVQLLDQAVMAVTKVREMYASGEFDRLLALDIPWLTAIRAQLAVYFDMSRFNLPQAIPAVLDKASTFLLEQTTNIITNSAKAAFLFVVMAVTSYYLFKDGDKLVETTKGIIPMPRPQVDKVFYDLKNLILVNMYSGLAVALLQGFLGWLLFLAVGIPSPIFWGAIMAFLSVLPLLGAFLVYIPAGLILMLSGAPIKGLIVILIGSVVISQVDNVLRPMIISGRAQIHPLLTFFSILGGIAVFGFVGFVIGPIIAAVFLVLVQVIRGEDQLDLEKKSAE